MKKTGLICYLLSFIMLVGCFVTPVLATDAPAPVKEDSSVRYGCHTIDAQIPLLGTEKRIDKGGATAVTVFALIAAAAIIFRLFYLSVFKFDEYQKKVIDQLTTENKVSAARGLIYDANMEVLAANYTVYDISVSPSKIASMAAKEETLRIWSTYYPGVVSSDISGLIATISLRTAMMFLSLSRVNEFNSRSSSSKLARSQQVK